jgi:hypothetical protein
MNSNFADLIIGGSVRNDSNVICVFVSLSSDARPPLIPELHKKQINMSKTRKFIFVRSIKLKPLDF